jgi:hypothetical protein
VLQDAKDKWSEFEEVVFAVFGIDFGMDGRSQELVDGENNLRQVFGQDCIHNVTRPEDLFKVC